MKLFTENNLNDSEILMIVDVQKEFSEHIPQGFVEKLSLYCKDFNEVFQVWDSNKAKKQSYKFPNEKQSVEKKYGVKTDSSKYSTFAAFLKDNLKHEKDYNYVMDNYNKLKNGEKFEFKNGYLIRVNNNHIWFYCNKKLTQLLKSLENKKVILVGGGDNECIFDLDYSLKSFGVYVTKNHQLIYSSATNDEMTTSPKPVTKIG